MNSNQYKTTSFKDLEAMGIKNIYKSHMIGTQKLMMFEVAVIKGKIQLDNSL
jgi:hypothetical protein